MRKIILSAVLFVYAVAAVAVTIQVRRDTAANWGVQNPVLAQGEWGCETDSTPLQCKMGDGVTAWNALEYSFVTPPDIDMVGCDPQTDGTANGPQTASLNAGETIAAFQLVYLHTDGEWRLADADDATRKPDRKWLALALEAGTDGSALQVALSGSCIRNDAWAWGVDGGALYVSGTAGALTQTAPSATDDLVRRVGYAISAGVVRFEPTRGLIHN